MMNCCHETSLHKLSKHVGCKATAKAKTSVASQANAMSSSSALTLILLLLKGSWSSAGEPLTNAKLPAAEAQASL